MKHLRTLTIALAVVASLPLGAREMKTRSIQPLFAKDSIGLQQSFQWTLDELAKCDRSLDIIVLPEFSEVPGSTGYAEFLEVVRRNGPALLEACAETARRCDAVVFCGAIEISEAGARNTLFVFDREGKVVGRYLKEHLTAGEWQKYGLDKSYTQRWNAPYMLEIDGLRYAFLTCYDFYFYENYSNIARFDPDIVIGSSHQRSDTHRALDIIDAFCAYNTGAYLVRASVSMGTDSPLGGCTCVVAPTGEILGNMYSKVGVLDVTIDPEKKYLKPAGYGNPPAKHCQYIEIGRRPWKYRPGGSAIALPLWEAEGQRICTTRGYARLARRNKLAAYGAAVAAGAEEIQLEYAGPQSLELISQVLTKLSCHCLMGFNMQSTEGTDELVKMIIDYDAQDYVYFTSSSAEDLRVIGEAAPSMAKCLIAGLDSLESAAESGCTMVQTGARDFSKAYAAKAHELGLRCNVCAPSRRRAIAKLLSLGADTIVTGDYGRVGK